MAIALFGLLTVALSYFALIGDGPHMELWHSERLTEEFSVAKAGEIRSFDDYRRLEDRLFAQLKALIPAFWPRPAIKRSGTLITRVSFSRSKVISLSIPIAKPIPG